MQSSNIPARIPLPFATSGTKNTIPELASGIANPNNASFEAGFPPLTMQPIASGGLPPYGQDMNGVLYAITQGLRWANAGGSYVYDSAFCNDSHVGGYPKGSVLQKSNLGGFWFNTVENNVTNPDTGGAGWVDIITIFSSAPVVNSIAALRLQIKTGPSNCFVTGYYVHGDGGGGEYYYDSADITSADNGGTIIVAADGGRWKLFFQGPISLKQFGATFGGVADDAPQWQSAIAALQGTGTRLRVTTAGSATTLIKSQIVITSPITIEFDSNRIVVKKGFNGDMFSVQSGFVKFMEPGIDGNATNFTGGGIRYAGISTQCEVENPNIINTADSCIIIDNTTGSAANNLVISGGALTPFNPTPAMSSSGPAGIRAHGPSDVSPGNRTIIGVTASSQPLLDNTGMWLTKMLGCFTGTVIFEGNPNVTGIVGNTTCSELVCTGNYIRDGMSVSGLDHVFGSNICHGMYPIFSSYGVVSGYGAKGWQLTAKAQNCSVGTDNEISNSILDLTPNGLGLIGSRYFQNYVPFAFAWGAASVAPAIGNGSFSAQTYNVAGANIECTYGITFGSTTTLGTGQWDFSLPFWSGNTASSPAIGTWMMFINGGVGWKTGFAYVSGTGATHKISLVDTAGVTLGSTYNGGAIASGSTLTINLYYPRN